VFKRYGCNLCKLGIMLNSCNSSENISVLMIVVLLLCRMVDSSMVMEVIVRIGSRYMSRLVFISLRLCEVEMCVFERLVIGLNFEVRMFLISAIALVMVIVRIV